MMNLVTRPPNSFSFFSLSVHVVARRGVSATDDMVFKVLLQVIIGTQIVGICEIQKRKVFGQVVLEDGGLEFE